MKYFHVFLRLMPLRFKYLAAVALAVVVSLAVGVPANEHFTTIAETLKSVTNPGSTSRTLYAVNQSSATRGSISVYDIDRGHIFLRQFRRSQM
jgi:hypothetical protein